MQSNPQLYLSRLQARPLDLSTNDDLPRNPFSSSQFRKRNLDLNLEKTPEGKGGLRNMDEMLYGSKTPSGRKIIEPSNVPSNNSAYIKHKLLYYGDGNNPSTYLESQSRSLTPTHRNYTNLQNLMPALYSPRQVSPFESEKKGYKSPPPWNSDYKAITHQKYNMDQEKKENFKESFQNPNPESITEYLAQNDVVSNRLPRFREKSATRIPPSTSPKNNAEFGGNKSPVNFVAGRYNGLNQGYYLGEKKNTGLQNQYPARNAQISSPVYNLPYPLNQANQGTPRDTKANSNSYNLILMAKLNDFERARNLLDHNFGNDKADVNHTDEKGWTALHLAVFNCSIPFSKLLLSNKANINALNNNGQTPFHICCQRGSEEMAHLLIESGADINLTDMNSDNGLHLACKFGHKRLVELLLTKSNIDWNHKNKSQLTPQNLTSDEEILKQFRHKFLRENAQGHHAPLTPNQANKETKAETSSLNSNQNTKTSAGINHDLSYLSEDEKLGPSNLQVIGMIGKGSFGEVYLVQKKDTKIYYAMKVIKKSQITNNNLLRYAMTERNILSMSDFPFIVKLHGAFQSTQKLFMLMEFCPGGDLAEMLQSEKKFSERKARVYLAEIVLAIQYLHERDIIFRDLKPDNIVIDSEGHAQLTDFGLSKEGVFEHSYGARSFCGSVAYLAPEMLKRAGHGKAVDWYLVGVILYEMLFGEPPYYSNSREDMFFNILNTNLNIPYGISDEARSLLFALLEKNPQKRLGSGPRDGEEIKEHPFFASIDWKAAIERKLKVQKQQRKIKIVTRIDPDIFDLESIFKDDEKHLNGWSFIEK